MRIIRHPDLAGDVREAAEHYADISERVLDVFWSELDSVIDSIKKNPRRHHFASCGLRRANFKSILTMFSTTLIMTMSYY